jgi:hypothetical protein
MRTNSATEMHDLNSESHIFTAHCFQCSKRPWIPPIQHTTFEYIQPRDCSSRAVSAAVARAQSAAPPIPSPRSAATAAASDPSFAPPPFARKASRREGRRLLSWTATPAGLELHVARAPSVATPNVDIISQRLGAKACIARGTKERQRRLSHGTIVPSPFGASPGTCRACR